MAKRASDLPSRGTRKPAGPGTRGAARPKTAPKQPVGGGGTAAGGGGIPARLAELGCDPIAIIAGIAMDQAADPRLRFSAAKELCAYLSTKPRQTQGGPVGEVDVAGIIARPWRLPAKGSATGTKSAKSSVRKRPPPKASGVNAGAGR